VVDKTGTLTEGEPKLTEVFAVEAYDEQELLMLAASLEKSSEHPFAAAIVAGAGERDIELMELENFNSHTGLGVSGHVNGKQILLGIAKLLEEFEVDAASLVKGDLWGIVRARLLSKATMRNIKENLFFAFVYNALGVPIAAGALYPLFGLLLSPMIAAAAMSFSSVSVVGNALRLRRIDI
jgi:cation transport ATPase